MKFRLLVVLVLTVVLTAGCYFPISGRVIDAETDQPIEGAVVLVEWTKTHGIGDHSTESYKVVEVVSDKEGKFELSGCFGPFVNEPDVTVYKKGYVAWNNKYIFPDQTRRNDFAWKYGYLFKMDKFKLGYSFIKHQSFIDVAASLSSEARKKEKFIKAYEEWEEGEVINERSKR